MKSKAYVRFRDVNHQTNNLHLSSQRNMNRLDRAFEAAAAARSAAAAATSIF
jgi:hypothetical protein